MDKLVIETNAKAVLDLLDVMYKNFREYLETQSEPLGEMLDKTLDQIEARSGSLITAFKQVDNEKMQSLQIKGWNQESAAEEVMVILLSTTSAFRRYRKQIQSGTFSTRLDGIRLAHLHDNPQLIAWEAGRMITAFFLESGVFIS